MTAIRTGTSIVWGQLPLWFNDDTEEMQNQQTRYNANYLVSANQPMIYQAMWSADSGAGFDINEAYVPLVEGDVVNVIFKIYATTDFPVPSPSADWDLIGQIKKSRDIPNTNIVNSSVSNSQRFTVDISRIVADQLSYSLVPIGKGSWQNQEYGGLNGGTQKQDNITETISPYNVTRNGAYRAIRVRAEIEMLGSTGIVELSTTTISSASYVRAINSVPSFNSKTYYNQVFTLQQYTVSQGSQRRALTNSPNSTINTTSTPSYKKRVSIADEAEFLQFYAKSTFNGTDDTDYYNLYEVYGQAYNKDGTTGVTFVLGSEWKNQLGTTAICSDISHSFEKESTTTFAHTQNQLCVQNVSPAYINAHAYAPQNNNYPYVTARTPITSNTGYYRVYVRGNYNTNVGTPNVWEALRHSNVYWYSINDEEQKSVYENVRFHWLNTVGGIDSYTATRNVMESISVSKSLMETKLPNRRYMQDNVDSAGTALASSAYYSDTMRGYDTYRGGTEVLSSDAKANNSVYTEPLNNVEAKWLREIFQSPNVWIEEKTDSSDQENYEMDAAYLMNQLNPDLRPATSIYKPVILTNSEIVSLDQEKGLVMYNIEYTESQGVLTQRN